MVPPESFILYIQDARAVSDDSEFFGQHFSSARPCPVQELGGGHAAAAFELQFEELEEAVAAAGDEQFNTLRFTSTDCTAPAYFDPSDTGGVIPVVPLSFVLGSKVYVTDGSPGNVFLQSIIDANGDCISFPAEESFVTPLRLLFDLSDFFTPPFTVR